MTIILGILLLSTLILFTCFGLDAYPQDNWRARGVLPRLLALATVPALAVLFPIAVIGMELLVPPLWSGKLPSLARLRAGLGEIVEVVWEAIVFALGR